MGTDAMVAVGSFDFLSLTMNQQTERSLNAGVADFESRKQRGMTEGANIYLLFGVIVQQGDGYRFVKHGERGIGKYEEYIINVSPESGKLSTVTEFGADSEVAFHDNEGDIFFTVLEEKGRPRTWIGGVACRCAYQRHDGQWLTITFAAAASGDAGPVDKSMARATVGEAAFLWYMQVRTQDMLDKAAKKA